MTSPTPIRIDPQLSLFGEGDLPRTDRPGPRDDVLHFLPNRADLSPAELLGNVATIDRVDQIDKLLVAGYYEDGHVFIRTSEGTTRADVNWLADLVKIRALAGVIEDEVAEQADD